MHRPQGQWDPAVLGVGAGGFNDSWRHRLGNFLCFFPCEEQDTPRGNGQCFMNGGSRKSSEHLMFSAWGTYRNPETEFKGEISKEGNGQGRRGVSFASRLAWVAPWWLRVKGSGAARGCLGAGWGTFQETTGSTSGLWLGDFKINLHLG